MPSLFNRAILLLAAILFLGLSGGLGVVFLKTRITATGQEIKLLEGEQAHLARTHHSLDAQLAALHNPDSLRLRARELGLSQPREDQIVRLSPIQQPYLSDLAQESSR